MSAPEKLANTRR